MKKILEIESGAQISAEDKDGRVWLGIEQAGMLIVTPLKPHEAIKVANLLLEKYGAVKGTG